MTSTSFRPDVFAAENPTLLGSRCTECGRKAFPYREVCPSCTALEAAEQVDLSKHGVIYSFTVVRQAPPGLETPYVLGYVDLPDDEVRVMSRIEGVTPEDVAIGQRVRLTARRDERADDENTVMFAFARTDDQENR